ncbi:phage capsid packaging protein [Rahnella aquatilis CIP 78.65 = ATCC 33071]|uniref:DUF7661 family protein n=1 Tax=Rahnella aquatilis TaxID=34038 RepID=UPI0002DB2128|nr:phage capsid packaging protein [Rahnella aquatilis CIP 78.65 = ATCC 33071]
MLIYNVFGRFLGVKKTPDGWQVFRADMAERKFSRLYDVIIPDDMTEGEISEVATKDDFFNIKKASQNDLLCAHRVPPQMMGIIPENSGGFGDSVKASQVFVRNELTPLQERFKELNAWFGEEVIEFSAYELTPE